MSPSAADRASPKVARQYHSEVAEIREARPPLRARYVLPALAAMIVAFLAVFTFARADRIVTSVGGKIVSVENQTVVQALDASIIRSIGVKEGDRVAKGELLATLDPTFAASAVAQLRAQINGLKAQIARDEAIISGKPLVFAAGDDAEFARYAKIQSDLYDQQLANYRSQLNSFDQKIELTKSTILKYQVDAQRYKDRTDIAQQIEDMRATLAQHGSGSQMDRLNSTDARVEVARNREFDDNSITENQHTLASLQADREAFMQQYLATISQDLATSQSTLGGAEAQLEAAVKHKDLVRIVAADDSIVLSIAKVSVGSVLREGDTLMTLTPTNTSVEAEVKISSRDIGAVRPGDPVSLKIGAFDFSEHGTVDGILRWISADAVDPSDALQPLDNGPPQARSSGSNASALGGEVYYKALVSITRVGLVEVPE